MSVKIIDTQELGNIGGGSMNCAVVDTHCVSYSYTYPVCNLVPTGSGGYTQVCHSETGYGADCFPITACW